MYKLFVYGTLKFGQVHHVLLAGREGIQAIAPHIQLHAGPDYPFAAKGIGSSKGEVYHIDFETLQKIDELEGHPDDYQRVLIPVILADGHITEAWIYLNESKAFLYPLIPEGDWWPEE